MCVCDGIRSTWNDRVCLNFFFFLQKKKNLQKKNFYFLLISYGICSDMHIVWSFLADQVFSVCSKFEYLYCARTPSLMFWYNCTFFFFLKCVCVLYQAWYVTLGTILLVAYIQCIIIHLLKKNEVLKDIE